MQTCFLNHIAKQHNLKIIANYLLNPNIVEYCCRASEMLAKLVSVNASWVEMGYNLLITKRLIILFVLLRKDIYKSIYK